MEDRSANVIKIFDNRASDYAKKFDSVEGYKEGLQYLCTNSKKGSKVLDMACGPGNISKFLLGARPDFELLGIDLAPEMIKIAEIENPTAHFKVHDIRAVKEFNEKFDAVVVGFGLPYLSKEEVELLISDVHPVLSVNGLIYLSFMRGDYTSSSYQTSSDGSSKMFTYYHEEKHVKKCLSKFDFKVVYEKKQAYKENDQQLFTDCILIAKKS